MRVCVLTAAGDYGSGERWYPPWMATALKFDCFVTDQSPSPVSECDCHRLLCVLLSNDDLVQPVNHSSRSQSSLQHTAEHSVTAELITGSALCVPCSAQLKGMATGPLCMLMYNDDLM
jgi:hypothetical protein